VSGHRKVFAIGLARTGTTSLHHAFLALRLRSAPSSVALLDSIDDDFVGRYDAFCDNPIPFIYRELDQRWPASRFVLTTRPVQEWIDSMRWLFGPGLDRLDLSLIHISEPTRPY